MNNPLDETTLYLVCMATDAVNIIRRESHEIIAHDKPAYPGKESDYYTNGDIEAQRMYVERIEQFFPGYGVIGEEEGLNIPCTLTDKNAFFIIDPLDGTKAYKGGQSHGVGTMIALVEDNEVVAACVGNANTGELTFFTRFFPRHVIRQRFHKDIEIFGGPKRELRDAYILLDKAPWDLPEKMQKIVRKPKDGGLFKDIRMMGGSIGTTMACLWHGEVEAVVCEPALAPWDHAAIQGINESLGLVYIRLNPESNQLERYVPTVFTAVRAKPHGMEIVTRREYADIIINQYNND